MFKSEYLRENKLTHETYRAWLIDTLEAHEKAMLGLITENKSECVINVQDQMTDIITKLYDLDNDKNEIDNTDRS